MNPSREQGQFPLAVEYTPKLHLMGPTVLLFTDQPQP